jgi:uncharacterized protein YcfJ
MSCKHLVTALLALVFLGACESNPSKEDIGMATGAVLGGVIGHQFGSGSGNTIATTWKNPNTGQNYTVTPTRTYEGASGPCREFKSTTVIDAREEVVHGTACRQPDGSWKAA